MTSIDIAKKFADYRLTSFEGRKKATLFDSKVGKFITVNRKQLASLQKMYKVVPDF